MPNRPGIDDLHLVQRGSTVPDVPALGPEARAGALGEAYHQKNRGRSVALPLIVTRNAFDLVSVIGDDQLAKQLTLTCQVTPNQVEGVDFPPIFGRLAWGNDGFQAQADFDFLHGTQVSVAGSFVRLAAFIDTDAPGLVAGDPIPAVRVGAHLSYLPPTKTAVYRTRYATLTVAPPTNVATLPIPRFAQRLDVLRTGPSGAVLVELLDRLGAAIASVSSAFAISEVLPNDARSVRVTNLALDTISARLVFSLWL